MSSDLIVVVCTFVFPIDDNRVSHVTYELLVRNTMSKVKERDEQEALKLDEHFKQTLLHVRTYILNLRSVEEVYLCRIWLDKLNSIVE